MVSAPTATSSRPEHRFSPEPWGLPPPTGHTPLAQRASEPARPVNIPRMERGEIGRRAPPRYPRPFATRSPDTRAHLRDRTAPLGCRPPVRGGAGRGGAWVPRRARHRRGRRPPARRPPPRAGRLEEALAGAAGGVLRTHPRRGAGRGRGAVLAGGDRPAERPPRHARGHAPRRRRPRPHA